jgi:hypothetical protein
MHCKSSGLLVSLLCTILCCAWLSAAWQDPLKEKADPSDPLWESIKERMGELPRLDPSSKDKLVGETSNKHRAAELMLKSARLLESERSEQLDPIAKRLREQVVVILNSD